MNTGQTLMTLIAMMLLTMVTTRVNTQIADIDSISTSSKYALAAISLAESKIEYASNLAYDEKTVGAVVNTTSSLTPVASLGIDSGENAYVDTTFDDFDDYNGFKDTVKNMMSTVYYISCTVNYVDPLVNSSIPGKTAATSPTWSKCLNIMVTGKNMKDTIRMSVVNSYWKFR
jgi:hypothetical protein